MSYVFAVYGGAVENPSFRDSWNRILFPERREQQMLKRRPLVQLEVFVFGPLERMVPEDHVLARVDRVLDICWPHDDMVGCYCTDSGRPGINPEIAVRLMLRARRRCL